MTSFFSEFVHGSEVHVGSQLSTLPEESAPGLEQHPLAWLVQVNGVPVDARWLPDEPQDEARRLGLIPDLGHPRAA